MPSSCRSTLEHWLACNAVARRGLVTRESADKREWYLGLDALCVLLRDEHVACHSVRWNGIESHGAAADFKFLRLLPL